LAYLAINFSCRFPACRQAGIPAHTTSKKQKPLQVLNLQGFFVCGARKGAQCIDPMFIGLFL
jgi:hypothetical protein